VSYYSYGDWVPHPTAPGRAAFLVIHSLAESKYLEIAQDEEDAARTWSSLIYPDNSTNGLSLSCLQCAPRLLDGPPTIALTGLFAGGTRMVEQQGDYVPMSISTACTAQLALANPCSLTWDELTTLNTADGPDGLSIDFALRSFTQAGPQMISHREGLWGKPVERGLCALAVPYQLDLWVDHDHPSNFGPRNFHADPPTTSAHL
jgi:hypothetical protein